jgi:hypothetical protein
LLFSPARRFAGQRIHSSPQSGVAIYGAKIEGNAHILYAEDLVSTILPCVPKTFAKGETHMDALNAVKGWIGALTEVGLMLLGLAIVCALLVGANLPFFGSVVTNIMSLVTELGKNGLVGLIALGIILWLFANRKMA